MHICVLWMFAKREVDVSEGRELAAVEQPDINTAVMPVATRLDSLRLVRCLMCSAFRRKRMEKKDD